MNIKALLATSVVAVAPFAFARRLKAAASDCWWHGYTDDRALAHAVLRCDPVPA